MIGPKNNLRGLPVMLSASLPKEIEGTRKAQDLFDLMVVLIGGILSSSGVLVFGGHPSVTPLIHRVACSIDSYQPSQILLFQMRRFRKVAPEEVYDQRVFRNVTWVGSDGDADIDRDLSEMRNAMVAASRAAIFIGGKTQGFSGRIPGILDEYRRFIQRNANGPAYLVGMLGGECQKMIQESQETGQRAPCELSEAELRAIEQNDNVDLVSAIILADLHRYVDKTKSR
jgi:hypothetical protein